jgi:hypothetical protein
MNFSGATIGWSKRWVGRFNLESFVTVTITNSTMTSLRFATAVPIMVLLAHGGADAPERAAPSRELGSSIRARLQFATFACRNGEMTEKAIQKGISSDFLRLSPLGAISAPFSGQWRHGP